MHSHLQQGVTMMQDTFLIADAMNSLGKAVLPGTPLGPILGSGGGAGSPLPCATYQSPPSQPDVLKRHWHPCVIRCSGVTKKIQTICHGIDCECA
jgi:hypothetical protein